MPIMYYNGRYIFLLNYTFMIIQILCCKYKSREYIFVNPVSNTAEILKYLRLLILAVRDIRGLLQAQEGTGVCKSFLCETYGPKQHFIPIKLFLLPTNVNSCFSFFLSPNEDMCACDTEIEKGWRKKREKRSYSI